MVVRIVIKTVNSCPGREKRRNSPLMPDLPWLGLFIVGFEQVIHRYSTVIPVREGEATPCITLGLSNNARKHENNTLRNILPL